MTSPVASTSGATPRIHMVVARGENGVIGDGDKMLWTLRDDLAYFKRITLGSPIVMGHRTWRSIGRPLPGRHNIVLSRQSDLVLEGATVVHTVEAVLDLVRGEEALYVIGGGEIYRLFMPLADTLHITEVHASPEGAATFPDVDLTDGWSRTMDAAYTADERNDHPFVIRAYRRVGR